MDEVEKVWPCDDCGGDLVEGESVFVTGEGLPELGLLLCRACCARQFGEEKAREWLRCQ